MEDYHINIFYSDEDEGYIADIPDLEACSAFGNTAEDALRASGASGSSQLFSGRAGCVPHPASAALGIGGPAVVGNAAAVAVPCGALDNAVAAVRWSKPWSLRTVT